MQAVVNRWLFHGLIMGIVVAGCAGNLEMQKKESRVTRDIGEAYLSERNYTAALREFLKAEKIHAVDPILQYYLGLAYQGKGLYNEAVTHYKKAISIQSDYAPAYNSLGIVYLELGEWDTAIEMFKELSENILYSTPHYAFLNLGLAYYNKGDYAKSAEFYNKVIKHYKDGFAKDPVYVKALRGLGKNYLISGDITNAEKTMEEALAMAPNFPPLLLDVAAIRQTLGKKDEAIAAYRKIIEVAPDSELADKAKKALSLIGPAE